MTSLLYVAHNRLAFTQQSFAALARNTDWSLVDRLYVADDASGDGTKEWLEAQAPRIPAPWVFCSQPFGGPVAAMLWLLQQIPPESAFAKIDSDIIVPPGWLGQAESAPEWRAGECDILGLGYRESPAPAMQAARAVEPARHIGGVGLMRRRVFDVCRPVANGRFGWTEFQGRHPDVGKGWLRPPLPVIELDRLPAAAGPWRALAESYERLGWQRLWPEYPAGAAAFWQWWEPADSFERAGWHRGPA